MGLNPSNNVANGFPTLGDPPFDTVAKNTALLELVDAGFPRGSSIVITTEVQVWKEGTNAKEAARAGISFPGMGTKEDKEWFQVHSVEARVFGWHFSRAWYYWVASTDQGARIPADAAVRLDDMWGRVLRVDGYAGGKRPQGDVSNYHIDRPDALDALIRSLKKMDDERCAELKRQVEAR